MKEKKSAWTLFSWRGVAVNLHISLLFLLFYIVVIALVQFPLVVERSGVGISEVAGSPLSWAIIFAFSLLASVIIHEFGHVLVAQAKGFKVEGITLMMLGGASHMEKMPEDPMTEFKVAIIGPIVSLAIAVILFGIKELSLSPSINFFCYWVGQTNLALAIFNMLPAFPLDGGRVLRAFLAARQGYLQGTYSAVKVSQVFAWGLGILGFFQLNFLLMLISFFIYAGAKGEYFILLGQSLLKGLQAKDLMQPAVTISANASLTEASQKMLEENILFISIIDQSRSVFTVSAEEIKSIPQLKWASTSVKDIMTEFPKVIYPDDDLSEVFPIALKSTSGGVPVVSEELYAPEIVGIIQTEDILKAMTLKQIRQSLMREKIMTNELRPAW